MRRPPRSPKQCIDDAGFALYKLICRHFVATLSTDCIFDQVCLLVSIGGCHISAASPLYYLRYLVSIGGGHSAVTAPLHRRSVAVTSQVRLVVSLGGETFEACASRCSAPGWTVPLRYRIYGSAEEEISTRAEYDGAVAIKSGDRLMLSAPAAAQLEHTEPPPHLSESELLELMEAHGVTDVAEM